MAPARPATDDDSAGVIDLIARVFAEYPGCVLDVDREEPELRTPASSFDRFWVVEENGTVVGCIACALHGDVVELVEATAHDHGARIIEFWSDTRFVTAHAVYEHFGYSRTGRTRDLHDLSNTTEYHYAKRLQED